MNGDEKTPTGPETIKETIDVAKTFECPNCRHNILEEIQENVTIATEVSSINVYESEYKEAIVEKVCGGVEIHGSGIVKYRCKNCGLSIREKNRIIKEIEGVHKYLSINKKIEEEPIIIK
jgi:predicted RNA-binding Zn-ribbon protein involved in translation (DUF1610 family)